MQSELIKKIAKIVSKSEISEDEIRSLMVLIRKILEIVPEKIRNNYLILRLFCNWAMHIEITESNTGLRILAKINDALIEMKKSGDGTAIGVKMSEVLFVGLRRELKLFFEYIKVNEALVEDDKLWGTVFIIQLLGSIRDVPLSFASLKNLDPIKKKIYEQIAKSPIKLGAGVTSTWISKGERLCLHIGTEDTTTIVVPMVIDVRLR